MVFTDSIRYLKKTGRSAVPYENQERDTSAVSDLCTACLPEKLLLNSPGTYQPNTDLNQRDQIPGKTMKMIVDNHTAVHKFPRWYRARRHFTMAKMAILIMAIPKMTGIMRSIDTDSAVSGSDDPSGTTVIGTVVSVVTMTVGAVVMTCVKSLEVTVMYSLELLV
jgi:hypothetical protein